MIRLAGIGDEAAPTMDGQLAALRTLGWTGIELRTVNGASMVDLNERAFGALADRLERAGVTVVCCDSGIGGASRPVTADPARDLAELAVLARRCHRLGTRYVRVMSYPDGGLDAEQWGRRCVRRMRELARCAEFEGLVLLHENCVGWAATSAERTLRLLSDVDSPALRLLFDTGNGVAHGYDGYALLKPLVGYVSHVHVKDALPGPVWTPPGTGVARVADCLRLLLSHGYDGWLSLEPHLSVRPHEGAFLAADPAGFLTAGRALQDLLGTLTHDTPATGTPAGGGPTTGDPTTGAPLATALAPA